jgi:hypothetical protein
MCRCRTSITETKNHLSRLFDQIGQAREHPRPPMWRRDFIPPKTLAESLRLAIRGGSAHGFRGLETRGHMDGTCGHRPGGVLGLR